MLPKKKLLTETQMGEVAVNMISNLLIVHSNGRLNPFKPIADDGGIDLLIFDKKTRKVLPCQVKSRTKTLNKHPKIVHFEVRKASYDGATFLIGVYLNWQKQETKNIWLITPDNFVLSGDAKKKYVFRPSIAENSMDKYQKLRFSNPKDFIEKLIYFIEK